MNKWEKHGYDRCIYDYENFGIKFCTNELERMLDDYNKQLIELEAEKEKPIKPVCEYHTNYPKEWTNVLKDNKAAEKIRKNRINCLKGILEGKRDKIQAELDKLNKSDKDR